MHRQGPLKKTICLIVCASFLLQQTAGAANSQVSIIDGVKLQHEVKNLALDAGAMKGAIVDSNGSPVAGEQVVLGQNGKAIAKAATDTRGTYTFNNLKPGVYQLATYAGMQAYRVHSSETAPQGSVKGVIQVMDDDVVRGAPCDGLISLIKSPMFIALLIAAAIVLPLALDDDDDAS